MKNLGYILLIGLIILILLPLFIVKSCDILQNNNEPTIIDSENIIYVKVLDTKNNKAMEIEIDEYIKGVVAAEMPVSFHTEALKAQAVAARTYTMRRLQQFGASPNPLHSQYDLCTDYRHCQAWISKEDRLTAWDNNTELSSINNIELWGKIEEAVEETKGVVITYNGSLIDPLFHSTSGGQTENSEDYFSSELAYLRSVSSQFEDRSPHLLTTFEITVENFINTMKNKYPDIKFTKSKTIDDIEIINRTQGGQIEKVRIGNKILSGREVREVLGLKSSEFQIEQKGSKLNFSVVGYGHGVGMSQYGADGMARAGYIYEEILQHYYSKVELKKKY